MTEANEPPSVWMAGFFDGEGTARAKIIKRDRQRTGFEVIPMAEMEQIYVAGIFDAEGTIQTEIGKSDYGDVPFNIGTRADFYQSKFPSTLRGVVDTYCQSVDVEPSYYGKESYHEEGNSKIRMVVNGRESTYKFLNGIRDYCIVKKPQIDIMLGKIIPMMEEGKHLNKKGMIEMMRWVDEMNSYKGGNRGKYNQDYFKDLWLDGDGELKEAEIQTSNRGRKSGLSSNERTNRSLDDDSGLANLMDFD